MAYNSVILQNSGAEGSPSWKAAAFLKKITDVVPSVIYIFNQKTQSNEYTNKSLSEAVGYSSQEAQDMGADLFPLLCHPDDLPAVADHFEALHSLADGEVLQVEYRLRHKQGHWVWLLSHDTVFDRDKDGSVLRHIGVASDISAQKKAEEHARQEQRKAEFTSGELRDFSYSMSHDMKSPSSTLHLLLNELLDSHGETLNSDALSLVYMALTTVTRMSKMVDDVLHYTRVVNQDLATAPIDLHETVQSILTEFEERIASTGAQITVGDLPKIIADEAQTGILLRHLIDNAIKFHRPDSPPQIDISAISDEETGHVALTIADQGIGIDPAKQEQVFAIFKRLNADSEYPGTGLGLAISRRVAANHHQDIKLVSCPGKGSAFTIGFPKA